VVVTVLFAASIIHDIKKSQTFRMTIVGMGGEIFLIVRTPIAALRCTPQKPGYSKFGGSSDPVT
jgi:hypothetical protein